MADSSFTVQLDEYSVFNVLDSKKIFNDKKRILRDLSEIYEKTKIYDAFAGKKQAGHYLDEFLLYVHYDDVYFHSELGVSRWMYINLILEELGKESKDFKWVKKLKGKTKLWLDICDKSLIYGELRLQLKTSKKGRLIGKLEIEYSSEYGAYIIRKYTDEYMYIDLVRLGIICQEFQKKYGQKLIRV